MRLPAAGIQLAFNALYGPFAWAYDWVSRTFFLGQWEHWQRAPLPFVRGRVLEVGFGTGVLVESALREGRSWIGVERSPQMIAQTKRRLGGRSARIVRATLASLPIATQSIDTIVSTFPSDYIVDPVVLAEFARVLRPGGQILIVPAGVLRPNGLAGYVLDRFHRVVYGSGDPVFRLPGPPGFVWRSEWIASPAGRAMLLTGEYR